EYIQTLLYPKELEKRARKLRSDARTAIEESGVNMLYLAFGFLEWQEPNSNRQSNLYAPLILLPVELAVQRKGHQFVFSLSWTEEDLQPNLSLAKKLERDFGLALPQFQESE